ncbi:Hint domain-containing protein [Microvirga lenta]|uniref:Hint domain-containing protein n=1 Tax=Microvirga lenta TaxID=2881337 RepID=UPI001CFFF5CC|nr:hypothetical protein [Microvirga lenta]MCB5176208.1 hypothetical protein [Microvirga lenta]
MMAAAELAVTAINARDIGYPPFGVFSTPRSIGISNSNAVIETLAVVMGLQPPLSTTLPIPGQGVLLLDVETILSIRAATWDRLGSTLQPHCFLADTPIEMADESGKPIQDIVPGDWVMAFDPKANNGMGAKRPARVRRTFRNTARQIVDLRGLRMTPGHVVLSDNGEWLKIVEVLRRDRALVEERKTGPVPVRARTGAVLGSDEDAPVTVLFTDRDGLPHKAVVRAGIVCTAQRRADGTYEGWSLARVLRHQNYTIEQDGALIAADGRRFDATPWPGGTPLDAAFQHDWVISVDEVPFTPAWIAELRDEDEQAMAVNETPVPFATAPPTGSAGLNRKQRRRLAALRVVK